MAYFACLGTSGAVPTATRDTTSLVFVAPDGALLVDCGGSPVSRLRRLGVDPLALTHVLITHLHADHAYGLPSLVQSLHLLGRTAPLGIVTHPDHVAALRSLLGIFGLLDRPGMFPLAVGGIDLEPDAPALRAGGLAVRAAANDHGAMPNVAVRIDDVAGAVVYSSDTRPSDAVVALARGAGTLVHEATFPERDRDRFGAHSTAADAGAVAARAGVRRLILVHVDAAYHDQLEALADEARRHFGGDVEVARELVPYSL